MKNKTILTYINMRVNLFRIVWILFTGICSIPFMHGQNGRVGINTATPAAALHVADSSVVFTGLFPLPNPIPNTPVSGAGSRLMWYTGKAGLRTGSVDNNQWDASNIGTYSFASGYNTIASGGASVSFGDGTLASANYSSAFGFDTKASGLYAAAFGRGTVASGTATVAFGDSTMATGISAVASGRLSKATGSYTFASGNQTIASGNSSQAFGELSRSVGSFSSAFGHHSIARAGYSFVTGRFNDTTATNITSWIPADPLFIVGNGSAHNDRKNALTILKNGNVGLFTISPTFRLHVANDQPADGGHTSGIMIENTNAVIGESGLSFKNESMPSQRKWTVGLDQNPKMSFNYGNSFDPVTTRMTLDTFGRLGIKTTSPQSILHVVHTSPSGGSFNPNSIAIFESNQPTYIQLSSENTDETGILSGNQTTAIRSAIVFAADSSVELRSGGNTNRLSVEANGNVGIGTNTAQARLDVNGNFKLGLNGTVLNEVIKASILNHNLANIPAGSTSSITFAVPNVQTDSAVNVSPSGDLGDGVVIGSARVSSAGNVQVRFINTDSVDHNPPTMNFYINVFR